MNNVRLVSERLFVATPENTFEAPGCCTPMRELGGEYRTQHVDTHNRHATLCYQPLAIGIQPNHSKNDAILENIAKLARNCVTVKRRVGHAVKQYGGRQDELIVSRRHDVS